MSWAAAEFGTIDLGDKRLDQRAILLAERLGAKPTASLPSACNGWAETQAAYRFFAKRRIDWRDLLAPHWECTTKRMSEHSVVLCIQDTTELDFNGQSIDGLGPLSYEPQRGMYVHPTYAVSTTREPLGILDAWMWAREPKPASGPREGVKESLRWIEGYRRVAEQAREMPQTRLVYVADREADAMELMREARDQAHPADWLIRCQHDRALPTGGKLWSAVACGEAAGEIRFTLPSRTGQKARAVRQKVWSRRVALSDGEGGTVTATCVIAREVEAPAGVKPIEWRLLTNREVNDITCAVELIDWYRARWEIEIYFHVLKNGFRVELLQLAALEKIERALALYMVVAWRVARLMRAGRNYPGLDAELLFDPDEWHAAYILNNKPLPKHRPKLNDVVRLIAMLGGFLARKGDGDPGVKTIWQGLHCINTFINGMQRMRAQERWH